MEQLIIILASPIVGLLTADWSIQAMFNILCFAFLLEKCFGLVEESSEIWDALFKLFGDG